MSQALLKNQKKSRNGLLIQMPSRSTADTAQSTADTTADDADASGTQTSTLLSLVLIVFESLLTFLLRHDHTSQRLAERLVARHAVIRVRTHLPAYTFYATFSHHGVLLDEQAPETEYLATVDGSIPTLFRAFMTAPPEILDGILIHGDEELVSELRQLMTAFNISNMLSNWISLPWFGRAKAAANQPPAKQQRIKPLLKRIDDQKKQIEQLNLTVKQQEHALQHLQFQYKMLMYGAAATIVLLLLVVMVLLLR